VRRRGGSGNRRIVVPCRLVDPPPLVLGVSLLVLGAGCSPGGGTQEVLKLGSAIVGGEASSREEAVRITATGANGTQTCTATIVAPNLIVTAQQCIAVHQKGRFSCTPDGSVEGASSSGAAGLIGEHYEPSGVAVYVGQGF